MISTPGKTCRSSRGMEIAACSLGLAVALFLGSGDTAALGYQIDNPADHFSYEPSEPGSYHHWDKENIRYVVVGDRSNLANLLIDQQMSTFSKVTRKNIVKANVADIFIVIDTNVFHDLKNDREKFISAGIMPQAVDELGRMVTADGKCISSSMFDRSGAIVSAYVLAKEASLDCVVPLLYDVFGVRNARDDRDGLVDLCVLYAYERNRHDLSPGKLLEAYRRDCYPEMN